MNKKELTHCPGCGLPIAGPASGACKLGDGCLTGEPRAATATEMDFGVIDYAESARARAAFVKRMADADEAARNYLRPNVVGGAL